MTAHGQDPFVVPASAGSLSPGASGATPVVFAGVLLMALLLAATPALADEPAWWNNTWSFRMQIDCPAGTGDVACVSVMLAGRTTATGRNLRLLDAHGQPVPFEILHHDPQYRTLLAFRVPPDEATSLWLYCGNPQAQAIDTSRQTGAPAAKVAEARNERKRLLQQRDNLAAQQRNLEQRLTQMRAQAEAARKSGHVSQTALTEMDRAIHQAAKQLEDVKHQQDILAVPPEPIEPEDPTHWQVRRGILLRIYRKAQPVEPKTLADLKQLAFRSVLEGAAFRSAVSDGFNPFGESTQYISCYTGYMQIDRPGEYAFCSASDDGSWIVVNGKTILDWPGPHEWRGAARGQRRGRITLQPGLARIEYYHEQTTGATMAFMGWAPPGQEHFTAIRPEKWLNVRPASVATVHARNKPLLAIADARVLNTWWVRDSDDQQAAIVECMDQSLCASGRIVRREWSFGDGLSAAGPKPRHVYFRTGCPRIELTVTDSRGNRDSVQMALPIHKTDVQTAEYEYGNEKQYVRLATGYDVDRMQQDDLEAYADFWAHAEHWDELARSVDAYLGRFGESGPASRLATAAARAWLSPGQYDPKRADELVVRALAGTKDPKARQDLLLTRARVLTWEIGDLPAAETTLRDLVRSAQPASERPPHFALMEPPAGEPAEREVPLHQLPVKDLPQEIARPCLVAIADLCLLTDRGDIAHDLYRQAERMAARIPSEAEETAKEGIYPYSVEDFLERGEFEWARRTLDAWEDELPGAKLDGYTLFLRGKVLFVEHPGPQALRYLSLAWQVAPRAVFVPEAVWLHANCLMAMGRYGDALPQLERIRAEFTRSEFFAQTAEKIRQCQAKLNAAATQP